MSSSEATTAWMGYTCPRCSSLCRWDYSCHTYPRGNVFFTCLSGCDSATRWFCIDDGCSWEYEHGLNPRNPRATKNESNRPEWLPDDDYESYRVWELYVRNDDLDD